MKIRSLSLILAVAMLGACDDKDTSYEQQVADTTMCVGSLAQVNRGQVEGLANTAGACANDRSLDVLCTVDIATTAATVGKDCVVGNLGKYDQIKTCTTAAIEDALADDPERACTECYSDTVVCAAMNCAQQCLSDSSAPACLQCQAQNCLPAFYQCTGLPAPQQGDAGP